jgi:hypothetical protein
LSAIDKIDGSGTHRSIATSTVGSTEIYNAVLADGSTGAAAQVAAHTSNNQNITGNSLLVGALLKLANAAGPNYLDLARAAGVDGVTAAGVAAVAGMLAVPTFETTTSSVAATAAQTTLNIAATAGFVAGNPVILEPGGAQQEAALITGVVLNTSITVQFPPGGAVYTHTANYTLMAFALNQPRQAPGSTGAALVSSDGAKATYRYAVTFTPITAPTDFLVIQGSASATGRIKSIKIGGIVEPGAAPGELTVQLVRRSSAGSGGGASLVAITPMKHDNVNDGAATLTVSYVQTANYGSLGTLVAHGGVKRAYLNNFVTGPSVDAVWDFSRSQDKAVLVRGTGDFICLSGNGDQLPASAGTLLDVEIEIEEDQS